MILIEICTIQKKKRHKPHRTSPRRRLRSTRSASSQRHDASYWMSQLAQRRYILELFGGGNFARGQPLNPCLAFAVVSRFYLLAP